MILLPSFLGHAGGWWSARWAKECFIISNRQLCWYSMCLGEARLIRCSLTRVYAPWDAHQCRQKRYAYVRDSENAHGTTELHNFRAGSTLGTAVALCFATMIAMTYHSRTTGRAHKLAALVPKSDGYRRAGGNFTFCEIK